MSASIAAGVDAKLVQKFLTRTFLHKIELL